MAFSWFVLELTAVAFCLARMRADPADNAREGQLRLQAAVGIFKIAAGGLQHIAVDIQMSGTFMFARRLVGWGQRAQYRGVIGSWCTPGHIFRGRCWG